LTQSSVLVTAHFHPNRLQNLFNAHISVPVSHGRQLFLFNGARLGINATHIDFRDKADFWGDCGVLFGTKNAQLVKATIVLCLNIEEEEEEERVCWA
jgi:hypothetical protein